MGAPGYDRCVDAIRSEQGHHISLLPFPGPLETFAKDNGGIFHLRISVGPIGVGIYVNYCRNLASIQSTDHGHRPFSSGNGLPGKGPFLRSKSRLQIS